MLLPLEFIDYQIVDGRVLPTWLSEPDLPFVEELIAAEATVRKLGSVSVPLLRLEHLLVLKVLAGRPQDLADVAALLRLPGKGIALSEVSELLRALGSELEEAGLVERFEMLQATAEKKSASFQTLTTGPSTRARKP